MREKLTVNVVEDIVKDLNFTSDVLSVSYDAETNQSTIQVCNIYHLRERMNITFTYPTEAQANFTVINWDRGNKSFLPYDHTTDIFIVEGNVSEVEEPSFITLPPLKYFHATPIAWNNHISQIREANNKFPAIYLKQVFRERRLGVNDGVRREAELLLFLLDNQALEEFNTDERYISRIEGLKKSYMVLENYIRTSPLFVNYDEVFTDIERPKFGIFSTNKGHTKGMTNTRCDAIEISFTLRMKPSCLLCKDGCSQC